MLNELLVNNRQRVLVRYWGHSFPGEYEKYHWKIWKLTSLDPEGLANQIVRIIIYATLKTESDIQLKWGINCNRGIHKHPHHVKGVMSKRSWIVWLWRWSYRGHMAETWLLRETHPTNTDTSQIQTHNFEVYSQDSVLKTAPTPCKKYVNTHIRVTLCVTHILSWFKKM